MADPAPTLPRVWGAMVVRDAVDLVEVNVRHHLHVGLERLLVIDNGSTDGTWERLRELAARLPVAVRRDEGPFRQAEMVNALVAEAGAAGADWVAPIDVDEFFVAPGGLPRALAPVAAAVVEAEVVNFVQRRRRRRASPRALLTMDHRPAVPLAPLRARPLVAAGRRAVVEVEWEPSVIVRPVRRAVDRDGQPPRHRRRRRARPIRNDHRPARARPLPGRARAARRPRPAVAGGRRAPPGSDGTSGRSPRS